jgi:hypothetical protein
MDEIDENLQCITKSLQITENDSIAISNATNPVIWKGFFNTTNVYINFTKIVGDDGETEKFTTVFSKDNNCLKIDRAYKFYDGKQVDISAITQVDIKNFTIQDYKIDEQFSGIISYVDPHDKETYTRKFWIELQPEIPENDTAEFLTFGTCIGNKIPINIDVNADILIDFKLIAEETKDIGNKPKFSYFTIKLVSTNTAINQILSLKRANSPYFVVFEPPFSSENTQQYFGGVKNELDVFYQFEAPYKKYNYFLSNNLTYKEILSNNLKDYFVISIFIGGKKYFGWIQFQLNTATCSVEIKEIFLNSTPNEHVFVN